MWVSIHVKCELCACNCQAVTAGLGKKPLRLLSSVFTQVWYFKSYLLATNVLICIHYYYL